MSAPTIEFPCPSAIKGEVMPYVASVAGPPFATGDGLVKTHAESYVAAKIDSAHEEIGEMCQPNFDGTDWERTVEFTTKMGLSIEPFYYVRENQAAKLVDVFTRHNAGYSEESAGFLSPSLRMAAVYRRAKNEQMFGTGLTRIITVHELAHSASEFDTVHAVYMDVDPGNLLLQRPSIFMPRVGYDVDTVATINGKLEYLPTRGTFFEEAYASHIAGLYGWEHEDRKLFKDEGTFSNRYKLWVHADQVIYEPKTLLNKMIDNRQAFSFVPSMATSAMRNFIALDPSIEEDFMNSRHSMQAIQNTYAKLDRLKPGLAKRLYNLPYSPDGFSKGLRLSYQVAAEHGVEVVPAKYRNLVQRWSPLKPVDESLPVPALVPGANVFEL